MSRENSVLDTLMADGWEDTGHTFGMDIILKKGDKRFLYNPEFQSGVILHLDESYARVETYKHETRKRTN